MNENGIDPFPELRGAAVDDGTRKKSWSELHDHVKDARKLQSKLTHVVCLLNLGTV